MAFKIALQLYSIRDEMAKDMKAALQKVKDIGYDYVEIAGYYGKSAEEIRAMLDEIGLSCISVHQAHDLFLEKGQEAVDFLKKLGASYCGIPGIASERFEKEMDQVVKEVTQVGKLMKENGLQLNYHNHEFEFTKRNGKYWLDELYERIPADLLETQLDLCWVHYGGEEPCAFLKKYAGRASVVHLKDFVCENLGEGPVYKRIDRAGKAVGFEKRVNDGFRYRPLGQGIQNFPAILEACRAAEAKYLVVEQDDSYDTPSLEVAAASRAYLKGLGV